jgi:hypothetical protein
MEEGESGPTMGARPAVFDDETFARAKQRAEADGRWLLVDVTDKSKPVAWAVLYTTWRDRELIEWIEANAVAIQVDVRADAGTTRAIGIEPGEAPVVLLFRDGKERLRAEGHQTAAELLRKLEWAELNNGNLRLARKMLKNPERDAVDRSGLAGALLKAGLFDEALDHYDWLWCHAVEVSPAMAGPRRSFIANEIAELCSKLSRAHARFAELRDYAAARTSSNGRLGREALCDFVVLNEALDEDHRTLAWLDTVRRREVPEWAVRFHLLPLLYEQERWADAGELIREPLVSLERVLEYARMRGPEPDEDPGAYERHLILEGQVAAARRVRRRILSVHRGVATIYRSLRAVGREAEAAAVQEAALRFEESRAMRAAVA